MNGGQKWCGQGQPHEPHLWTEVYGAAAFGMYWSCAGCTGVIDLTSVTCSA